MKAKVLSFAILALLLAFPIAAQQQDDPANPPNPPQERPTDPDRVDPDQDRMDRDRTDTDVDVDVDARTRTATDSDELPRTASPLALFALLGLGGASTATGLRMIRRRK